MPMTLLRVITNKGVTSISKIFKGQISTSKRFHESKETLKSKKMNLERI